MNEPVPAPSTPPADGSGPEELKRRLLEATGSYGELDVAFDFAERTCWSFMRPVGAPSFTPGLLHDITDLSRQIRAASVDGVPPIDWFVGGSRLDGIYNLGGDLTLFAALIREGERDRLRHYAHRCVALCSDMTESLDLPLVTITLVQGEALGGGFECAMSFNVLVAERRARFGLPEILFNLFPGMGAYSYLARRLDGIRAERMILSGKVFTAAELHEMGIVDVLAEDGRGEAAVSAYIAENRPRHGELVARLRDRRQAQGFTRREMLDVTDIWVEAALRLSPADLRRMERLTAAQARRIAGQEARP